VADWKDDEDNSSPRSRESRYRYHRVSDELVFFDMGSISRPLMGNLEDIKCFVVSGRNPGRQAIQRKGLEQQ